MRETDVMCRISVDLCVVIWVRGDSLEHKGYFKGLFRGAALRGGTKLLHTYFIHVSWELDENNATQKAHVSLVELSVWQEFNKVRDHV